MANTRKRAQLCGFASVAAPKRHIISSMPMLHCSGTAHCCRHTFISVYTVCVRNCFKEAAFKPIAHDSQAVAVQVYWCAGVEQCLSAPSPPAALAQYMLTCTAQLGALTRLVRGTLPDLHRRTLSALITIDVHARDIVDNLIRQAQLAHFVPFFWTLPVLLWRVTAHFYVGTTGWRLGSVRTTG